MPLISSTKKSVVRKNALEMMASGRPADQSWAAAYQKQREAIAKRKKAKRGRGGR